MDIFIFSILPFLLMLLIAGIVLVFARIHSIRVFQKEAQERNKKYQKAAEETERRNKALKLAAIRNKWNKFSTTAPSYTSSLSQDEGWVVVDGKGKLHFWLYKISPNGDNMRDATYFLQQDLPKWIEKLGYVIDYNHVSMIKPNNELSSSIKSMLNLRGCNMAVYAYQSDTRKFVELDVYDVNEDIWWSGIIPIID